MAGHDASDVCPAVSDTLGIDGLYRDPMWRVTVELTDLERALLTTWWVRRLGFIAHAGAAAIATTRSYSRRLEHSLGLLALTTHFDPDDHPARAAALLHDVGHLPLSHTFEGVAGLDHHALGSERIADLAGLLGAHGVDADEVMAIDEGRRPSVLSGGSGALKLDHLESFVRSGRAHGRTRHAPAITLGSLSVIDGMVSADADTAAYLYELTVGEARWLCSTVNAVPSGIVRHLASLLLSRRSQAQCNEIAEMTDDEFWALLLDDEMTRDAARALRQQPNWTTCDHDDRSADRGIEYTVPHLYLDMPLIDGEPGASKGLHAADMPTLPWGVRILPPPGVRLPKA